MTSATLRLRRVGWFFLLALGTSPVSASAQRAAAQLLVQPTLVFQAAPGGRMTVFGPSAEMEIRVTLINEDAKRSLLVLPGFFAGTGWEFTNEAGASSGPVATDWDTEVQCGPQVAGCQISMPALLAPGDWLRGS